MTISRRSSAALAIGIGCVILYIAGSLYWHRVKHKVRFADDPVSSADPFAAVPPPSPPESRYRAAANALLYDFHGSYERWVSPYKPYDSQGRPFFPASLNLNATWFGGSLRQIGERSLFKRSPGDGQTYYRLLIIPTFDNPVCFRVSVSKDGTAKLRTLVQTGEGGYSPGPLKESRERDLTAEELATVVAKFSADGFWKTPDPTDGMDGSMWVFEESTPRGYQAVDHWSPSEQAQFSTGELLLQLSGLTVDRFY